MAGSADLVIRVLADTSNATGNVNALVTSLGKLAGLGAAAGVAGGIVEASMKIQDAMAKVQAAYNNASFSEGTASYQQAKDFILQSSTELATSADDLATVYAQGARYLDEYGNRLPTDKVQEFTTTMAELAKVSTDGSTADALGQQVSVFQELFNQATNFGAVGSAIAVLANQHNLGEGTLIDAATGIAQVGADLGVSQAQALGLGNFLSSVALGGQMGGSSVGRILLNMTKSADSELDPTAKYADVVKDRTAQERLGDLQTQLKEEQARKSEMYGQHGLKTQYRRNPEAVMAADDRIAKLQRDIADQQQNIAHLGDAKAAGGLNITTMAATAGQDADAFSQLFKSDPITALLDYAQGLRNLPPEQRSSAEAAAGFKNVRDLKVVDALANNPSLAQQFIDEANGQLNNPDFLASQSAIPLGTTSSKVTDVGNAAVATAAAAGDGPREAIDGLAQKVLDNTAALDKLDTALSGNPLLGTITTGVVSGVSAALPIAITTFLARKGAVNGAASTAAGNGAIATAGGGVLDVAGTVVGTAGVVAAAALPFVLTEAYKQQTAGMGEESKKLLAALTPTQDTALESRFKQLGYDHIPDAPGLIRQQEQALSINVPNVQVTVQSTDGKVDPQQIATQVYEAVVQGIGAAWNHVAGEHPVTGQQGGDYTTGTGPN